MSLMISEKESFATARTTVNVGPSGQRIWIGKKNEEEEEEEKENAEPESRKEKHASKDHVYL